MVKFLTKSEFISKLNRTVKLYFYRKDFNLEDPRNLQIVQEFIQGYMNKYNFTCDHIKIQPKEKGMTLRLKKLRRKSSGLINIIFGKPSRI
ncbi:MAG: hypothetical protein ACTSRW_11195 [Candidatus Helarchaeota archaeon]